jgi:hypothetical protein
MTIAEQTEYVAKAIWEQRVKFAAASGIELEPWGDGSIPQANGVMAEARAALEALAEIDQTR